KPYLARERSGLRRCLFPLLLTNHGRVAGYRPSREPTLHGLAPHSPRAIGNPSMLDVESPPPHGRISLLHARRKHTAFPHGIVTLGSPIAPGAEFALEGEHEEPLIFSHDDINRGPSFLEAIMSRLDKAILALRVFKQGPVGYNFIRKQPIGFCPTY